MLKEFKEFAIKGNAIDLAIGVIMAVAFGAVITSLVGDVMMPPIGKLLGGVDFSNQFFVLGGGDYPTFKAAKDAGAATVNYGVFLNTVINFLIVAFVMFMLVRVMNRLKREQPAPAVVLVTKDCPFCATAIPIKATRCPRRTSAFDARSAA